MEKFFKRTFLLWSAFAALIIGYFLLIRGDLTAAPLLLVVGYCILLPLFLWRSFRDQSGE